ncbi:LytR family transcriptional regulator [Wenjunlia vitaminophila]|uniref:LytR family transcriptional regulator n=1 Tax=Wenjunlia vitaminophila TaxID=76728 RepID=A0A0T6LPC9_WENVI|nr:LytTR family DNA-binding domain-containing protein [Wenjunlia vitaminophila]KRV47762.1 LytR family transcriptional regulator [Wenjunlia vitaminophila]
MLRALAVDDEEPALEELLYLLRADPRVARAEGAVDATAALRRISRALEGGPDGEDAIDVVFLDIHMAGLNGLDMARLLAGFAEPPLIVFVTAYEDFAVRAFDLDAVDYVLKPVRRERLAEAVRRVAELAALSGRRAVGQEPAAPGGPEERSPDDREGERGRQRERAAEVRPPDITPDHIPVELAGVTRFVQAEEITYAEAQGDYARLHTVDGASHLVRIPLSVLEERWRAQGFVRIHRRHLVALRRIDELRLDAGSTSVRVGDAVLAVSRRHARELRDLLVRQARDR